MATSVQVVALPERSDTSQQDVTVTLPAGVGWEAVAAVPVQDRQGRAIAVTFDNGGGGIVWSDGITAEDTSPAGDAEAAFTNKVTIPADTLAANDRIRITAKVKCLDNNGTDTVALKLKLAAASGLVASTLVCSSVAAVDAADNDTWQLTADLRVVAIGAAATAKFTGSGASWKNGATPAFLGTDINDDTSVATNADIDVGVTYTWDASHADNDVRIKELFVVVTRPE
ncbi:MAG: hypothetical protein VW405_08165 [Rhodospirillaceae bacterium]